MSRQNSANPSDIAIEIVIFYWRTSNVNHQLCEQPPPTWRGSAEQGLVLTVQWVPTPITPRRRWRGCVSPSKSILRPIDHIGRNSNSRIIYQCQIRRASGPRAPTRSEHEADAQSPPKQRQAKCQSTAGEGTDWPPPAYWRCIAKAECNASYLHNRGRARTGSRTERTKSSRMKVAKEIS